MKPCYKMNLWKIVKSDGTEADLFDQAQFNMWWRDKYVFNDLEASQLYLNMNERVIKSLLKGIKND